MNIRHLTVFRAVCEEMNFTKAAEKLYMTQPAISHSVRELEEDVGTALFERFGKRIYMTQAGEKLLRKTVRILELYGTIEGSGKDLEKEAPLRVGSSITIAIEWLPRFLNSLLQEEKARVRVEVSSARQVMAQLRKNLVDVAFVEGPVTDDAFVVIPFSSYPIRAVCGPGYPISPGEMTMKAFAGERLLLREKGSAVREALDSLFLLNDITAEPAWVSVNSQALLGAAKQGLGIAVLPEVVLAEDLKNGNLREVRVEGMALKNENHLVYHRDKYLTEPIKRLIGVARAVRRPGGV